MDARELTQIGPYRVRRFINEGAQAWVFEVTDPRYGVHEVVRALKLLKPEWATGKEFERFRAEAALLAGFTHQNLVTIFDFDRDQSTGWLYYTMTYVDGPTLAQLLRDGALEPERAVEIFTEVLAGLAELHQKKIIHRDIKPGNVFTHADGHVRLGDLGIARVEQDAGLTRTGTAVGTVLYMSPEQARGRPVDAASDVFSVGLSLYQALTGCAIYDNVDDVDSTSSHDILGYLVSLSRTGEELEIVYPSELAIPAPVQAVIKKACRFDPNDRYPNARAMRDALQESVVPAARAAQSSRWPWVVAAGTTVVALAVAGAFTLNSQMERRRALGKLDMAARLSETTPTLLERAKDLESPLPDAPFEAFDEALDDAHRELERAQQHAEKGSPKAAGRSAEDAIAGFEGVCTELADPHLAERADDRAKAAEERVAELRDAGAAEDLPDGLAELEARLAALAPRAALRPCAAASDHLDRIGGAGQVLVAAAALERGLSERQQDLTTAALVDAEREQELAEAERVDVPEYNHALDRAGRALTEGKYHFWTDLLAARAHYQTAAVWFQKAAAIARAVKARNEVKRLEKILGTIPLGSVVTMIADAGDLYDGGKWKEAALAYENAIVEMLARMQDAVLERKAKRGRADALAARKATVREGVER